jgi:hypothetical protein
LTESSGNTHRTHTTHSCSVHHTETAIHARLRRARIDDGLTTEEEKEKETGRMKRGETNESEQNNKTKTRTNRKE